MKATLARYPLLAFFVLAFALSWVAVTPLLLNPALPVEPFQMLGALAGPTLAAVSVTASIDGRAGLRAFFRRYVQWRVGVGWWLFTLFGLLVALTLAAAALLGAGVLAEFARNLGLILPTYLLTLIVGVILGPLWEEPGWRGFALPRLQAQLGPVAGTVALGVVWALWHLPGYLGGWMLAQPLAVLVSSVAFSVVMTWVYNRTGGSLLLMILLHSSSNAALSVGARVLPAEVPAGLAGLVYGGWIPALTYVLLAAGALALTRGTLGYAGPRLLPASAGAQPAAPA
jgi:membrane protease YdiL (CAAX protease family)